MSWQLHGTLAYTFTDCNNNFNLAYTGPNNLENFSFSVGCGGWVGGVDGRKFGE